MKNRILWGLIGTGLVIGAANAATYAPSARSAMVKSSLAKPSRMSTSSWLNANNKLKGGTGNSGGGKTDVDMSGYATESWVMSQGFISDADVGGSDVATKTWVENQGYMTPVDMTNSNTVREIITNTISGMPGVKGDPGDPGAPGAPGAAGAAGLSAYEIAVQKGFVGNEVAWLASLRGTDGARGDTGAQGPAGPGTSCAAAGAGTYLIKVGIGGTEDCLPVNTTDDNFIEE